MSRPDRRLFLVGAGSVLAGRRAAFGQAAVLPAGSSNYKAAVSIGARALEMRVFAHVPASGARDRPVLFVMHGLQRDADRYRDEWRALSDRHGVVVLVPEFSNENFPRRENYNFGGVIDREGAVQPRREWRFQVIDQIFEDFVARTGSTVETYDLYGHSAGAQFAHRFALLGASRRVRRIITANAGSYSMPVLDKPFPWGLGGIGLDESAITQFLQRDVTVLLGDADVDPNHPSLPRDPEAMAQGPHRLARGNAFFVAVEEAARGRPVRAQWRKELVPGVAHDNAGMAIAAAALLYGRH